eukprot:CAMPEP_0116118470 /NCGR_PEP_ID=MMETSP0329-20121206/2120_1 /TAXON_ID=697910 /ORGANISM="Pseudo-nitzschia arenysensis, Strain B593" /LENGTH=428 /DNA_ID=CAMNT_0003612097 /DNA_START=143 /DNA_END=1429 /DNA_ORIENTATION=-
MIQAIRKPSICSTEFTSSVTDHDAFPFIDDEKQLYQLECYDDDIREIVENSCTKNDEHWRNSYISSIDRADLKRISLIGSGQFCNVYSVSGNLPQPQERENRDMEFPKTRSLLAFKTIDPSRVRSLDELVVAAIDLANEAKILSQLDHKNIIRLRGISSGRFSQSFISESENCEGFFLVIDMLRETLSDRLKYWRKNFKKKKKVSPSSIFQGAASKSRRLSNFCNKTNDSRCSTMYNRIENTVLGIAEGMEYLHSKEIILRDLKPANIGFDLDTSTQIRLFDFGMARKITDCSSDEICGSPRYMAPEVMCGKGYSFKVDVYSYGVLLFEICSLESPYLDNYWSKKKLPNRRLSRVKNFESTMNDFYLNVVEENLRPSDDLKSTVPCPKMRELISDCWSADPDDRPTFSDILRRLRSILNREECPTESH